MALSRPLIDVGHLPWGDAPAMNPNPPGGVNFIIECPAAGGLPEVIRIIDSDKDISSNEEEVGVAQVGILIAGDEEEELVEDALNLLDSDEGEDEDTDDEVEEDDFQDEDDWFEEVSGDSGYDTMTEDEDDPEGDDEDFWQAFWRGWRHQDAPVPAPPPPFPAPVPVPPPPVPAPVPVPQQPTAMHWQEPPGRRLDPLAPSTSGSSFPSTKRSREEDDTGQEGTKRTRRTCEDSQKEPTPSTSGLGPSTSRSRGDDYWDSALSTSGLRSSTPFWMGGFQFQTWSDDSDFD